MTPRRFLRPLALTWVASIAAVAAATVPNWGGRYDPNLAVLTLTLITVIWYTYFSYRAVHAQPATIMVHRVEGSVSPLGAKLVPVIENHSPRTVEVRCLAQMWIDGQELARPGYYTGRESHTLLPFESMRGVLIATSEELKSYVVPGQGFTASNAKSFVVMLTVWWKDDLGEAGVGERRYYVAEPDRAEDVSLVVGEHQHRRWTADVSPFAKSFGLSGDIRASEIEQQSAAIIGS